MKKLSLQTPAVLVDEQILANNIKKYQNLCTDHGKKLWPMIKTHKSTAIVNMQQKAGADGFLCGTLDECESLAEMGIKNIMYAYPASTFPSIDRIVNLSRKCGLIIRLDGFESARLINAAAKIAGVCVDYTIIVDSGLHRLGVPSERVRELADALRLLSNIRLRGVSTHPGHIYGAASPEDTARFISDEKNSIAASAGALREGGYQIDIISSGSTPSFSGAVDDKNIGIYHPGNYVFHDAMQVSLGVAGQDDCAMTILASVISRPRQDLFIIDAGSKTLGLDKGAHGGGAISGFGMVKGHPEIELFSVSEEVGRLAVSGATSLKVGDKIEIIPNHACVCANLTSSLIFCRADEAVSNVAVDIRGNSKFNFV